MPRSGEVAFTKLRMPGQLLRLGQNWLEGCLVLPLHHQMALRELLWVFLHHHRKRSTRSLPTMILHLHRPGRLIAMPLTNFTLRRTAGVRGILLLCQQDPESGEAGKDFTISMSQWLRALPILYT